MKHILRLPVLLLLLTYGCSKDIPEIMASDEVFDPLTRYQCCPPTCGAAAAVLCSDEFAK